MNNPIKIRLASIDFSKVNSTVVTFDICSVDEDAASDAATLASLPIEVVWDQTDLVNDGQLDWMSLVHKAAFKLAEHLDKAVDDLRKAHRSLPRLPWHTATLVQHRQ